MLPSGICRPGQDVEKNSAIPTHSRNRCRWPLQLRTSQRIMAVQKTRGKILSGKREDLKDTLTHTHTHTHTCTHALPKPLRKHCMPLSFFRNHEFTPFSWISLYIYNLGLMTKQRVCSKVIGVSSVDLRNLDNWQECYLLQWSNNSRGGEEKHNK